ncbi:hypothetical protein K502DRAFT_325230 [Neoconidiobolus thromboides FSU 785]|nr:hypothetical protein K502DRAFT_325230 [Neoconidiobolus thromboides FSU 785]
MKYSVLFFYLASLVVSDITGTYKLTSTNADCTNSTVMDLTYAKDQTLIKKICDTSSGYKLVFGIWHKKDDNTIQELYSNGGNNQVEYKLESNDSVLVYNNLELIKVNDDSRFSKLEDLFGKYQAAPNQEDKCSIATKLEITNNGQILKYYCKDGVPTWFSRGFFTLDRFDNETLIITTTFNGTRNSDKVKFLNKNSISFNGVIMNLV